MENLPDDHKPDPLGSASTVRMSISQNLPGVDWSDPTWGIYDGDEFLIEFNTGEEDPIDMFAGAVMLLPQFSDSQIPINGRCWIFPPENSSILKTRHKRAGKISKLFVITR